MECVATQELEELKLCLQVDDKTLYNFCGKVNEDILINCTKDIENILKEQGAKPEKIRSVFELVVETLQNMLNYSVCTKEYEKDKKESPCSFTLSYQSESDSYIIDSCNLIEKDKKEIIEQKLAEVKDLTKKELRKLALKKVRTKVDRHHDGAGLGFIAMAKKSTEPIHAEFLPYTKDILKYKQRLIV